MIMYKPLADSTLMGMTKKEIIEQLRTAEHNFKAMEETVNQQAENFIKLLAEERKHGHWFDPEDDDGRTAWHCSVCDYVVKTIGFYPNYNYCPCCGARMDKGVRK